MVAGRISLLLSTDRNVLSCLPFLLKKETLQMRLGGHGPQLHRPAPDKPIPSRRSLEWTRAGAGHRCPETAGTRRAVPESPSRVPDPVSRAHATPPVAREVMPPDPGLPAAEAQTPTWAGSERLHPPLGGAGWGRAWAGRGAKGGGATGGAPEGTAPLQVLKRSSSSLPGAPRPRCPPEKRPLRPPRAPRRAQGRRPSLGLCHASLVCSPGAREGTRQILGQPPRTGPLC